MNLREWLAKALHAAGAKEIGPGVGMGIADISFKTDGVRYNISTTKLPVELTEDTPTQEKGTSL